MKSWNGWGDEKNNFEFGLSKDSQNYIANILGESTVLPQITLDDAIAKVPQSRAPQHKLINTDAEVRLRHCRGQSIPDWLATHSGDFGTFPDGVAFPSTTIEVQELLQFAKQEDLIIIPYGGGTSVCGHINPEENERPIITVALTKMNNLIALDQNSQIATFGAGTLGPDVEKQLSLHGYTLGHFPQSWELSTIGGWVASRSSGQQSLRYGRIEKMFAGGKIETLQGTLEVPTFPASSAGPDVREMILGSEGRIGIITEVKVRVTKIAEQENFYVAFFPSWLIGMMATRKIVQQGTQLSMMRLSNPVETASHLKLGGNETSVKYLETYLSIRGIPKTNEPQKTMFTFGITGSKAQCKSALKITKQFISEHKGIYIGTALGKHWEHSRFRSPYLRQGFWDVGIMVDTMETCLDWSVVPEASKDIELSIANALKCELNLTPNNNEKVHVFTHLSHFYGQGCSVYTTYLFRMDKDYDKTMQRWLKLKAAGAEAIIRHGGTISHQHGVGKDHAPYLLAEKGELGMKAIKGLCHVFDPEQRMNPGTLV
ncbi:FAD-linked oxidase [Glaciecola punicea]|jgi:alkyldihydroxyacetonephosphate synthase|uniref:FAD-binding oxidoreductase n=1 Tax=Glaciecola punicea TaxID=56804 RepID=UPI000872A84B|nr:FAD-binding oxidoreductase [Glaciecola punicea]OFA31136.1 FAD-linked oxidase [Glaciecola punicea]